METKEDFEKGRGFGKLNAVLLCAILVGFLTLATPSNAGEWAEPEKVAAVEAGELNEARPSWWGFDPEDSTEALQSAIDSGAERVVVEDTGSPWIVRPIRLRSDLELVFEDGVEVQAKRGAFKSGGDTLFTAWEAKNLTLRGEGDVLLRMWREDYDNPDLYERAEWRHILSIRGCRNVSIRGLTLAESGGDGIYLGSLNKGKTPNERIRIRDVVCDGNYRQGISVISAQVLLIEDTVLKNTSGTAPSAGIDFEPNGSQEVLQGIVLRNVRTENNRSGFLFFIRGLDEPVDIRLEDCVSVGDSQGFLISVPNDPEALRGKIHVAESRFENSGTVALGIRDKPADGLDLRFQNCRISPQTETRERSPVVFYSTNDATYPVGGVAFDSLKITDFDGEKPMRYSDSGFVPIHKVTGEVVLKDGKDGFASHALSPALVKKWMPGSEVSEIPMVDPDGVELGPVPDFESAAPFEFEGLRFRKQAGFRLWAAEGDAVTLKLRHGQMVHYPSRRTFKLKITGPEGETAYSGELEFQATNTVRFTASRNGIYAFHAKPGKNWFAVESSTHPIAVTTPGADADSIRLVGKGGDFYFYVPKNTARFGVRVRGQGTAEHVGAALYDPSGNQVAAKEKILSLYQFEVTPDPGDSGVWRLETLNPVEDYGLGLRGVPFLFSPAPEALLGQTTE